MTLFLLGFVLGALCVLPCYLALSWEEKLPGVERPGAQGGTASEVSQTRHHPRPPQDIKSEIRG